MIFKKEKKTHRIEATWKSCQRPCWSTACRFQTKFTAFSVVVQSIKESVLLDKHTDKVEGTNITWWLCWLRSWLQCKCSMIDHLYSFIFVRLCLKKATPFPAHRHGNIAWIITGKSFHLIHDHVYFEVFLKNYYYDDIKQACRTISKLCPGDLSLAVPELGHLRKMC